MNGQQAQGDIWGSFILLGIILLVGYFLLWRPQSKRHKEHETLLGSIKNGDEIVTTSGIMGRIDKINKEGYFEVMIAKDTVIYLQKNAVMSLLPKGTIKQL